MLQALRPAVADPGHSRKRSGVDNLNLTNVRRECSVERHDVAETHILTWV
jgi:hypothetical protein